MTRTSSLTNFIIFSNKHKIKLNEFVCFSNLDIIIIGA